MSLPTGRWELTTARGLKMTETADPHSITPYSVSIDNGPRHLVLGLSVRLKIGWLQPPLV
jgi:hypothetical protein